MKTVQIVLSVAIAVLLATSLLAQDQAKEKAKSGRPPKLGQTLLVMERLRGAMEQLDLSADQKEKLTAIREKLAPKMKEVWGKGREILTEEQANAAGEAIKQAREAGKKGEAVIEAVQSAMKLTGDQKEKLLKVEQESLAIQKGGIKEIMGILTPEQQEKLRTKMWPERKKDHKPHEKSEVK